MSAIAGILVFSQTVLAHQFSVADGTVVVHGDRVEVELEFSGEDLRHFAETPGLPPDGSLDAWATKAAATMLDYLRDHLRILAASGERLKIKEANTHITGMSPVISADNPLRSVRIRQSLVFVVDSLPNFLSFEHLPGDEIGGLRMQWTLAGRFADGPDESLLRLTSRGNFDVLSRDETTGRVKLAHSTTSPSAQSLQRLIDDSSTTSERLRQLGDFARTRLGRDRFTTIYALIDVQGDGVLVSTSIPASLLPSFGMGLVDVDPMVLDSVGQQGMLDLAHFQAGFRTQINQNTSPFLNAPESCVLPPNAMVCGEEATWSKISRNAARCCVHHWHPRSDKSKPVELRWGLFNGLVLTAKVFVLNEGRLSEHEIGASTPTLEIAAGKP